MPRIYSLDLLKAFAIYCVVLGHTIAWTLAGDAYHESPLFIFIYSFHMPLFVTVSGWFFGKSLALSPSEFLKTRAQQLLLPVVSFFALFFLIYNGILAPSLGIEPAPFLQTVVGGDMWFLKYLFAMNVLLYLLKKGLRRDGLVLVAILLLFSVTRTGIFRLLPYLWLGYFLQGHQVWLSARRDKILLLSGALFVLFTFLWQGDYDAPLRFLYFKPRLALNFEHLYAVFVRLGVGVSGSIFFILLSQYTEGYLQRHRWTDSLLHIGRNTLGIYCLQIYLLEYFCERVLPLKLEGALSDVWRILLAAVILGVCFGITCLLERGRWTRRLFLGTGWKH